MTVDRFIIPAPVSLITFNKVSGRKDFDYLVTLSYGAVTRHLGLTVNEMVDFASLAYDGTFSNTVWIGHL